MNKVLIVARYFGTRVPGLIKYLPEFGWQPILLTVSPLPSEYLSPGLQVIQTPSRDTLHFWKKLFKLDLGADMRTGIKRRLGVSSKNAPVEFLLNCAGAIVNYPDGDKGWKPSAISAGDELLKQGGIDAIISSSSPVTAHVIASELKKRHVIPWVADLRDPWSQNPNYSYGPVRRWLDKRLELKTLSIAEALVTVAQPWADNLSALHSGKTIYVITNGFNPEELNIPPAALTANFTITFTGRLYEGNQDTTKIFIALRDLISAGTINPDDIEVRFYTPEQNWLDTEIKRYGLSSIIKQYGMIARELAVKKQRESQLLLEINWESPNITASSLKLKEYLAAQRPILVTGGASNYLVKELLAETKAGTHAATLEEVKDTLKMLYKEYKLTGQAGYEGDIIQINKYSYREIAKKYSEVLNSVRER